MHALSLPEVTQWAYAVNFSEGADALSAKGNDEPPSSAGRKGTVGFCPTVNWL